MKNCRCCECKLTEDKGDICDNCWEIIRRIRGLTNKVVLRLLLGANLKGFVNYIRGRDELNTPI